MLQPVTETQVRELGANIYNERARLAAETEVTQVGQLTERSRRIAELDLAAQFSGIALRNFSRR